MKFTVEKIMASVLIVLALSFTLAAAQKAEESKEVVKAFPPALSQKYSVANQEVEIAQARLVVAQQNARLVLYAIADEMELTKLEKETCPIGQTQTGAWIFKCPAPPAKTEPKKPPESKKP